MPVRLIALFVVALHLSVHAQAQFAPNQWAPRNVDSQVPPTAPAAAFRPMGAPSIVDQYKPLGFSANQPVGYVPSAYSVQQQPVRQTAYQVSSDGQQIAAPQLQRGGFTNPESVGQQFNQQNGNLVQPNVGPIGNTAGPIAPNVPQPRLGPSPIATIGNSSAISPPSSYYQSGYADCGPYAQTSAVAPTVGYNPPVVNTQPILTPAQVPYAYAPDNGGYRPLIALGAPYTNVQVGQGIIGQPTVYVPGQPVRNFLRYLSP